MNHPDIYAMLTHTQSEDPPIQRQVRYPSTITQRRLSKEWLLLSLECCPGPKGQPKLKPSIWNIFPSGIPNKII